MADTVIPLFRPSCTDLEISYVTEVLRSGWWGMGPKTEELEEKFARYVGAGHAVAVNSATMALQLTCQALGVRGGEIIMPALTFASTGLAAVHNGARIVFADIDEDTLCLDPYDVADRQTRNTRAVIPVWYGGTVRMPSGYPGVMTIEDCAHACGSLGAGKQGIAACWSFHAVKNLAAGDGGMITTDAPDLAARLRRLRWCGIDRSTWDRNRARYSWEYDIREPGHKAHMNDITAALALAQLERLDGMNAARRAIVRRYLEELDGERDWMRLPQWREDSSWHLFTIRVPAGQRDAFIGHMATAGVTAGVHYKPLNTYPIFGSAVLPVTDRVWQTLVTLPLYPDMTETDVSRVIDAARTWKGRG